MDDLNKGNLNKSNKGNLSDVGMNSGTTPGMSGTMPESGKEKLTGDWNRDRIWWQNNFRNRPYATADRGFEDYEPSYRFGYESANRYRGKNFIDVEPNLRKDWDRYESRGHSTWENVKDSVHDAWDRITGKR